MAPPSPESFERAVAAVDWSRLAGCYGPSDGSAVSRGTLSDGRPVEIVLGNVPGALRDLARETEEDAWCDAMDVLYSHVSHQGDIHDVTAHVVPFVFDLIELREGEERTELAAYLVLLAQSAARYEVSRSASQRRIGAAVNGALAERRSVVVGWLDGELAQEATAFLAFPVLREPILSALARLPRLPFFALAALAILDERPPWALDRARAALDEEDPLVRLAAAVLLAVSPPIPENLVARVATELSPDAHGRLASRLRFAFDLEMPHPAAPPGGELDDATVLYAGPMFVMARTDGGRQVTLHWPDSGCTKGERIRVGFSVYGEPQVVETIGPDGRAQRVELRPRSGDRVI